MDVAKAVEEFGSLIIICAVAVEVGGVLTHYDIANQTLHVSPKTLVIVGPVSIQNMNRCLLLG